MEPMKHFAIAAISGPIAKIKPLGEHLMAKFKKVELFPTPNDCGDFPNTEGYTAANWAQFESENEDGALFPFMTKCMDAVLDYTDNKYERQCNQYPGRVEKHIHWPKFGGDVFAVTGHVLVYPHRIILVH